MNDRFIDIVVGTGRFSQGEAIAKVLASAKPNLSFICIDPNGDAPICPNSIILNLDLNPFHNGIDYEYWSNHILVHLRKAVNKRIIRVVYLCAARYSVGPLKHSSPKERLELLGLNICGKLELLYSVLKINDENGHTSSKHLRIIDFNSLHSIKRSKQRVLYNSGKDFSCSLSQLLASGDEVAHSLSVAAGPIDTSMLHWNHWVLKEKGAQWFFNEVKEKFPKFYKSIFIECDKESLIWLCQKMNIPTEEILETFNGYMNRRSQLQNTNEGITNPNILAELLIEFSNSEIVERSIFWEVRSPNNNISISQYYQGF